MLGKYTYLYDLGALGQDSLSDYDQRSQILSIEGIYRRNTRWEFSGKLAQRVGSARLSRNAGPWFDNTAEIGRGAGALRPGMEVGRHGGISLAAHAREPEHAPGLVGWRGDASWATTSGSAWATTSTQFSDDLRVLDFDHKGWFLNMTGSY